MLTEHLPRIALAYLPTPLEEMPRLRAALGPNAPRLFIKRDDQTGLATGGNKTRKLEFVLGEALAAGADTLITTAGIQSNHCRQTAAAAARLGLKCILVLRSDPLPLAEWNGNLLLEDLLGAEIRWAGKGALDDTADLLEQIADEVRSRGGTPFVVPLGASVSTGAVGYVAAIEELAAQLNQQKQHINRIVFLSGSGGTHAGLLAGVKAFDLDIILEGITNFAISDLRNKVLRLAHETAEHIGSPKTFTNDEVIVLESAGTHAYGVITDAERGAMRLIGRTEGIITDPVYTGRALAGLIKRIREGAYRTDEVILFWHTGGTAGLFPRSRDVMSSI